MAAGGPAEAAGLKPGEIITAVDGISVAGEARYDAAEHIAGEEGTSVTLTIRGNGGESREVTLGAGQHSHRPGVL